MVGKEKNKKRPDFATELENLTLEQKYGKPKRKDDLKKKDKGKGQSIKLKKKQDMQPPSEDEMDKNDNQEKSTTSLVSKDLSNKITEMAREQVIEENDEYEDKNPYMKKFDLESDLDDFSENEASFKINELEQINSEDERSIEQFMHSGPEKRIDLAQLILSKIKEKENGSLTNVDEKIKGGVDPKVVSVYEGVGKLLHSYTFGKLPKAFTIIPALSNWEEIIYLTNPESWSPQAMYKATKIFSSNLSSKMSERFYNCVLLPAVIDDIRANKKLNYHLYQSLRKALFRPTAFYQGILIPLCQSGRCTLREATIVSSVINRISIPVLHSAVAILKLVEMEYSGSVSLILNTLFQKKYALPLRVLEACVDHYYLARKDTRQRPTLWHQSLLTFSQRYKQSLSNDQKEKLKRLAKFQYHPYFTEEIKRELIG